MGKIIFTQHRPSNSVSIRAFLYSGLVIAASLILLPVWQDEDKMLYRIRQGMYISILPMGVMIAMAIYQRVEQYGITVSRYLVLVFLGWLMIISLFMIFKKRLHIRRLFISLMGVGVVSVFARPINASSVAYRSQLSRIQHILEESKNIKNSNVKIPLENLTDRQSRQLTDTIRYIIKDLGKDLSALDKKLAKNNDIYTQLGIDKPSFGRNDDRHKESNKYYGVDNVHEKIDVTGYSSLYKNLYVSKNTQDYRNNTKDYTVNLEGNVITFVPSGTGETQTVNLHTYIEKILLIDPGNKNTTEELLYKDEKVKLLVSSLTLLKIDNIWNIERMNFDMLVK